MDRRWSEIAANSLRIIMIDHDAFLFVHQTTLMSCHSLLVNEVTGIGEKTFYETCAWVDVIDFVV